MKKWGNRIAHILIYALICMTSSNDAAGDAQSWNSQQLTPVNIRAATALQFEIHYVYHEEAQEELKPLGNGSILRSNDLYKIIFTSKKKSYVYIFQTDESGNIEQLFPMSSFKGIAVDNTNPVRTGTLYHVPAGDRELEVVLQTQLRSIYFLASKKRDKDLETDYAVFVQQQHDALRKQLAGEKLLQRIQRQKLSSVAPIVNVDHVDELPLQIPATEKEIVKTLRIRPLIPPDLKKALDTRRARSANGTGDDPFKDMPKVGAFLLFEGKTDSLPPESYPMLNEYGKALQREELRDSVLVIAGHTDNTGNKLHNLALARRRAEAVKQFLVSEYPITEDRLLIKSYGGGSPIASNDTEEGRRLNNRIEFIRVW